MSISVYLTINKGTVEKLPGASRTRRVKLLGRKVCQRRVNLSQGAINTYRPGLVAENGLSLLQNGRSRVSRGAKVSLFSLLLLLTSRACIALTERQLSLSPHNERERAHSHTALARLSARRVLTAPLLSERRLERRRETERCDGRSTRPVCVVTSTLTLSTHRRRCPTAKPDHESVDIHGKRAVHLSFPPSFSRRCTARLPPN